MATISEVEQIRAAIDTDVSDEDIMDVFVPMIAINASLIVLDFLPIPPLPGGMLLREFGLISEEMFWSVARWGGLVLLILFQVPQFRSLFASLVGLVATPFLLLIGLLVR